MEEKNPKQDMTKRDAPNRRDTARRAYSEAEKEIREKQIKAVKELVLKTLEKLETEKKARDHAMANIRVLQKDLDDMKAGRLDRIEERQKKDPAAKAASVAIVERVIVKEEHHHHEHYVIEPTRWYEPWQVTYGPYVMTTLGAYATINGGTGVNGISTSVGSPNCTLNNSIAADYSGGAYTLATGVIMHI
jgi:hypothetical protein